MTRRPFEKRKQGETSVVPEAESEQADAEPELQLPKSAEPMRAKLHVKRKQSASRGKSATSTNGSFAAPEHVDLAAECAEEAYVVVFRDVTASEELEVENTQPKPVAVKGVDVAEMEKKKAWEEAKYRLAERTGKDAQQAPPVPVASAEVGIGDVASEDTTVTGAEDP